jgi:hypothetical protein
MKKYLIMGGLLIAAGVIINYSLGGFKPITPELISTPDITLYGWTYEGNYASDSLNSQIELLRSIIKENNNTGILTIANYMIPELEKRGVVRQFIGIEWINENGFSIENLDSLHINSFSGIQFKIPIKPIVMPNPEKLKALAEGTAEAMNTSLQGFSLEQYKDKSLILNFPLK